MPETETPAWATLGAGEGTDIIAGMRDAMLIVGMRDAMLIVGMRDAMLIVGMRDAMLFAWGGMLMTGMFIAGMRDAMLIVGMRDAMLIVGMRDAMFIVGARDAMLFAWGGMLMTGMFIAGMRDAMFIAGMRDAMLIARGGMLIARGGMLIARGGMLLFTRGDDMPDSVCRRDVITYPSFPRRSCVATYAAHATASIRTATRVFMCIDTVIFFIAVHYMHFSRVKLVVVVAALLVAYGLVRLWKGRRRQEGLADPEPTTTPVIGGDGGDGGEAGVSAAQAGGLLGLLGDGPQRQIEVKQAGGKAARPGRYPWIVRIMMRDLKNPKGGWGGCTGFLISPTEVITADHCADGGLQPKDIRCYVGAYKADGSDVTYGFHSVKSISRGGGPYGTGKDWAILTMKYADTTHAPVRVNGWNANVTLKKNMPVWSAGFGVGFKGENFPVLQVNELRLTVGSSSTLGTSGLVDGEYRTPCSGDSGGPLFIRGGDASQDVVIGIVSGGTGRLDEKGDVKDLCRTTDYKRGAVETYVRIDALMKAIKANIAKTRGTVVAKIADKCSVSGRILKNGKWQCPSSHVWDAGVSDAPYTTPAGLAGKQCTTIPECAVAINKTYVAAGAKVNPVRYSG